MAYIKQVWQDGETIATAERMKHIEDGIKENENISNNINENLDKKLDNNKLEELNNIITISALTGYGVEDLKNKIKEMFFSGKVQNESLIISNNRHKQALFRALENCNIALERVKLNEYLDLISIYVTAALKALGEIRGAGRGVDLVNKIFSEFWVGK